MKTGNEYKLLVERLQYDRRRTFFTTKTIIHNNNFFREVVDFPTLDTSKIWLDRVLGHLV